MDLLELALLAIASAFWPILVAVDLVALRTPRPAAVLGWFLAGGLLTTIGEGLVIVFVLEGTPLASRGEVGGWANFVGGIAALAAASLLKARAARPRTPEPVAKVSRSQRAVESGGWYAFGAGVVLNLFPGVFPLIALRLISSLDYGNGAKVLLIVALYLCTFALVEVPLLGLLIAPERVEPRVRTLNAWLDRNGMRLAIDVLALIGLLLLGRGVIQLLAS
jgi:hypothetical protein